jgi:hypothetical protein
VKKRLRCVEKWLMPCRGKAKVGLEEADVGRRRRD